MPTPKLYELAKKACIKNIRSITDIGDVPYDLIRPVLLKLEYPEQLRELEEHSPQLYGADEELWREFIKRDIPNWHKKPHEPVNPRSWYKVYRKLRQDNQNDVDAEALNLKAALDGIKAEQAKHTSRVVDPNTEKLPRIRGTRAEGGLIKPGGSLGKASLQTYVNGSKTKTLTGKGVIDKARREAREQSVFSLRKTLLSTPTHKLNTKATIVRSAPQGLVDDHRKALALQFRDVSPTKRTIIAPRKRSSANQSSSATSCSLSLEEKERRLKALTSHVSRNISLASTSTPQQEPVTSLEPVTSTDPVTSIEPKSNPLPLPNKAYTVLKRSLTPDLKHCRPAMKKKAPVDIFMPVKKRKIS